MKETVVASMESTVRQQNALITRIANVLQIEFTLATAVPAHRVKPVVTPLSKGN